MRGTTLIASLLVTLGWMPCSAHSQSQFESPRITCPTDDSHLSLERVHRLIGSLGESSSVDSLLDVLKSCHPDLFQFYNLVWSTQSRQHASARYPRVILSSPSADFVLAFSGNPYASGYQEIELYDFSEQPLPDSAELNWVTLQPDYRNEGFRFQRIEFRPVHSRDDLEEYPKIGEPNEPLCQSCHGSSTRPNWESYNVWEGNFFRTDHLFFGPKFMLHPDSKEGRAFEAFYKFSAGFGRYRHLDLQTHYLSEGVRRAKGKNRRIAPSQFTQHAGYLNYRRIAHEVVQSADYEFYRWSLLGALYECNSFIDFFPEDRREYAREKFMEYLNDTTERYRRSVNHFLLAGYIEVVARMRLIFEDRGIDISNWSMNFRGNGYEFVTPGGSLSGFVSALLGTWDPELRPFMIWKLTSSDPFYDITSVFVGEWLGSMSLMNEQICTDIRTRSVSALNALQDGRF